MENYLKVGMADLQTSVHPRILTTLGLGSCVGIALYDPLKKIVGLAHIMLPSSLQARQNTNLCKFADTAIIKMMNDMIKMGASEARLVAKLAGGAQMFEFSDQSDMIRIGVRNVVSTKEILGELRIPILSEDTGGNYGRTIELCSSNGSLMIKTIGHGIKYI